LFQIPPAGGGTTIDQADYKYPSRLNL